MASRTPLTVLLAAIFLLTIGLFLIFSLVKSTSSGPQEGQPAAAAQIDLTSTAGENADGGTVDRIREPYAFSPRDFSAVTEDVLASLVNILCLSENGTVRPISGSGVIIDPRGVILTNAHVAQYLLLAESPEVNLSCQIRTGSPARAAWAAEVLFIPPTWVEEHAADLAMSAPMGTGEHDYALLRIIGPLNPSQVVSSFLSLPVDTREGIAFPGDSVLAAAYPAEFIGSIAAQSSLSSASTVSDVKDLLTFAQSTVDLLSLGGIPEAQSGASGGPIVNAWGYVVGLISTTSEGPTPADRDLRALTLSYINRDLQIEANASLADILRADVAVQASNFRTILAPTLTNLLLKQLKKRFN